MASGVHTHFKKALVVTGIKLLQDFEQHSFNSLMLLLEGMRFRLKKEIVNKSIFVYSSFFHTDNSTTVIFLNMHNLISKVKYLNINIESLYEQY